MMKKIYNLVAMLALSLSSITASAQVVLLVQDPAPLAGSYQFTYSSTNGWGGDMSTAAITADLAFAYDATAGDSLGCNDIINRNEIEGKIAVVYRGSCDFSAKALNVQDSGAVALIIINNIAGAPVGMGGGASSAGVTIPVAMISNTDGALLRDEIIAGNVTVFLGNNTNLFANNVGSYKSHIGMANSQSTPIAFAQSSSDYSVLPASWVFNFGSADATGVVVSVTIDRDGAEVYNETSAGADIPSGDSLFFSLPDFAEDGYDAGYYTMIYTITSDDSDQFPDDNTVTANFWINNENIYSKSHVDPVTGPVGGNGIRPADGTEYEWCVAMSSENAEALQITGMTFATLTNSGTLLTDQAVQLAVYEWGDPYDGTAAATFTDLNPLTDNEFYDYESDDQGVFVTHTFAEAISLLNGQKYLACATVFVDNMFISVDAGIDYNVNYDTYTTEIFFPVNDIDAGTWFPGGFGTDNIPAIIVNLEEPDGIAEDVEKLNVTPYPNPTVDMINIPLGASMNGTVFLNVYDMEGRMVMNEELCQKNSGKLSLDVTSLSSGLHTFNLTFEDNSTTTFKVMISK